MGSICKTVLKSGNYRLLSLLWLIQIWYNLEYLQWYSIQTLERVNKHHYFIIRGKLK